MLGCQKGALKVPMVAIVAVLALAAFAAVRYAKAAVAGQEFAGKIRGIILSNPLMPDDEVRTRLDQAAAEAGVTLDPASVAIERGSGVMGGGAIASVSVRYRNQVDMLLFSFERAGVARVGP